MAVVRQIAGVLFLLFAVKAVTAINVNSIFGVMEAAEVPDCCDNGIVQSAFSRAAALLRKHGSPHFIMAESDHVKSFLLDCGFREKDVKVYPYVAAKLITDIPAIKSSKSELIEIGYLGGSRAVRHPELMADMMLSQSIPDSINLNIQLDLNYIENKRGRITREEICEMHEKGFFKLYPPDLSMQEYRALFCSLDFIILPYGDRYQQIGSGVFLEAIYAKVVPILPAISELNNLYTSLGGEAPTFKTLSSTAIREAINDSLTRFSCLKKNTAFIRENWQNHPSSEQQWQSDLAKWLPLN